MARQSEIWLLLRDAFHAFVEDNALSRGAAVAFYAMMAAAPILFISAYLGGLVMGGKLARSSLVEEISRLAGRNIAELMQSIAHGAGPAAGGFWAGAAGVAVLVLTAGGVFMEVQSALNAIWRVSPPAFSWTRFLRSWAESIVLVAALGFLLMASLLINAVLDMLGSHTENFLGVGRWLVWLANFGVTSVFLAVLFGAIYVVLPNRGLRWRDVAFGAVVTTVLFQIGELLIGFYLGLIAFGHDYGSAGGIIVLLMWVYYSAQVFLLGAELTKVWSLRSRATATPLPPGLHKVSAG
jgi:membrane protein